MSDYDYYPSRLNSSGSSISTPPSYRYSTIFSEFLSVDSLPELELSSCDSSIRSSLDSENSSFIDYDDQFEPSPKRISRYSSMKSRHLSFKNPLSRRAKTPSGDSTSSTSSLPHSIDTASSSVSSKSKKLFSKIPSLFDLNFELPFVSTRFQKAQKKEQQQQQQREQHVLLSRRQRKPSTLDFRCCGMEADDFFLDIEPEVLTPDRCDSPVSCKL